MVLGVNIRAHEEKGGTRGCNRVQGVEESK